MAPVAQLVASLNADTGVMSLIPALPHTFVEIDQGHSLPSADSRRAVVRYWQKYVLGALVNHLDVRLGKVGKVY